MPAASPDPTDADVEKFIATWKVAGASERANSQLFLTQFCDLLALPAPEPAKPDEAHNTYVFERNVHRTRPDGTVTTGRIDLYRLPPGSHRPSARRPLLQSPQGHPNHPPRNPRRPRPGHLRRGEVLCLVNARHGQPRAWPRYGRTVLLSR